MRRLTVFAFAALTVLSVGCAHSGSDDFLSSCPLGTWRCNGNVIEKCVSHMITNDWVPVRNCSESGEVCTNDYNACHPHGLLPPCCA
jgi:hypothetical protein